MSVAFAEYCNLPHGLLNARLLPHALFHNLGGYNGLLKKLIYSFSGEQFDTDLEAYTRLTDWLEDLIANQPAIQGVDIHNTTNLIVKRMLQDSGLPEVSHGLINAESLTSLIVSVANASR
jgi:alcohol dehydrogenase class IV